MDGLALAQAIRAEPRFASLILVMLSSLGHLGDAIQRLGIARCLNKPIRQSVLYDALATVLGTAVVVPAPRRTLPQTLHGHILLVEDNMINQQVALGMLHKLGVTVEVAVNGREAIEEVAQHAYDLVLMDCEMPELDGFAATRILRQQERERETKPLPIIAMTAHAVQSARAQCLEAGMDDYLAKPIKQETLATILGYWLARKATEEEGPAVPEPLAAP